MHESIEHWAGQLIVGGFEGREIPADVREAVRRGSLGGIILFARNLGGIDEIAELVYELATLPAPRPLWLAIDQEGGRVARLKAPFPTLPSMRELARRGPEAVHLGAVALAEGLRRLGFHQDYAPVVDVDTNPDNPVIGDRSFSRHPAEVAALAATFVRALQAGGIAASAKHFPGHGDTRTDSHLELPVLPHDLARLEAVELVPFAAAVEAGVATVMTAHVLFPALDPTYPATLSETLIEPILRGRFGFQGVVVSDDLEMRAVADHFGIEDAAVRAVRAGCDQLLVCRDRGLQDRAFAALVAAARDGRLPVERLRAAAGRVEALKRAYVRPAERPVDVGPGLLAIAERLAPILA